MSAYPKNAFQVLLCGFLGWFATGCDGTSSNEAAPELACRIERYSATSQAKFYNRTTQTNYAYDAAGNLTKMVVSHEQRPANGAVANQTGTTITAYAYDANGFLTTSTSQEEYVTITNKTIREQITTTKSFSYAVGRLAGYTVNRVGAYGITTMTTGTLAYNAAGELVSKTETNTSVVHDPAIAKEVPIGSGGVTRIWTYLKNQLVDYVERAGNAESRPLSIQNGLVTKITGSNYEVRINYDGRQRVIRQENYANGQLIDYNEQTWTDVKPSTAALPLFKGFPTGAQALEAEQPGVPASRKSFYWNSVAQTMQMYSESTSAVQTNAQGFVTGAVTTTKHPTAADQDETTTETYTYTGCR